LKGKSSECLRHAISPGGKQTGKGFDLTSLQEKCPKGTGRALIQKALKLEKRDSEYGDTKRGGRVSTAKNNIIRLSGDNPARGQEGNFEKRRQVVLYGRCRRINDARIFLEQNQKAFFFLSGEIFSDLKLDSRVIAIIQVGHIQGNEEGNHQEK
jgi:hypothetical protein